MMGPWIPCPYFRAPSFLLLFELPPFPHPSPGYVQAAVLVGGWQSAGTTAAVYLLESIESADPNAAALWNPVAALGPAPRARAMHSAVLAASDPAVGDLYARVFDEPPAMLLLVFGGWEGGESFLSDMHSLDMATMRWAPVQAASMLRPSPRGGHSASLVGRRMFVFGGQTPSETLNELLIFDIDTAEWSRPKRTSPWPASRSGHTAVVCGPTSLLIYGGFDGRNLLGDVYVLDTEALTWTRVETPHGAPHPRTGHAAALFGGRMMVCCGWGEGGHLAEVNLLELIASPIREVMVVAASLLSSELRRAELGWHKDAPTPRPPLAMQWFRARPGAPFCRIDGAVSVSYLPTADDVGCRLAVSCAMLIEGGGLGPSTFGVANSPVKLDPDLAAIVQTAIDKGFAEFRVWAVLAGTKPLEMALQFHRESSELWYDGAVKLTGTYEGSFLVILATGQPRALVLQMRAGVSVPLSVKHAVERDVIALTARAFFALSRRGRGQI